MNINKTTTVGEAIKLLKSKGFTLENQRGSHQKYRNGEKVITIVYHSKDSEQMCRKSIKQLKQILEV